MKQLIVENNFRKFFVKFDNIIKNRQTSLKWNAKNRIKSREASMNWIKKNREKYNETKRKYLKKHGRKWAKKWRKENREKYRKQHRDTYARTRTPENIVKNRVAVSKWKKKNPEKTIEHMITHYKKYGKILGRPWSNFQNELLTWAKVVKTRDSMECMICKKPAEFAHHIFYKQHYPKLVLNLNNGISLCKIHHNEVHGINLINNC